MVCWKRPICIPSMSCAILRETKTFTTIFFLFIFFRSSFSEFAQKYGKDDRFKVIEKIRERESLFNEFIVEVRKREKEDKQNRKEQVSYDRWIVLPWSGCTISTDFFVFLISFNV